jgi:hypothetical protein
VDRTISYQELAKALGGVAKKGLPVTFETAGDALPHMRCVIARAVHPDARLSRIKALDQVLEDLLNNLGDSTDVQATRILFAVADRHRNTTLTHRRELIASLLDRDPDHVRQEIQPRLLMNLALEFGQLNAQYQPRVHLPPPEEIAGDTPSLTEGDFTAHEEIVSRIWSLVYAIRAEFISIKRQAAGNERTRHKTIDTALWATTQLLALIDKYIDEFGSRILHGDIEYAAERLIRLAGWHPPMTDEESQLLRLTLARGSAADRNSFLKRLRASSSGRELQAKWRRWMDEFANKPSDS